MHSAVGPSGTIEWHAAAEHENDESAN